MNKEFIGTREAAAYICVSLSKLYKLTHTRELRYSKIGTKNVFRIDDLRKFIEGRMQPDLKELRTQATERCKNALGNRNRY